jgi:CRP-like cAMP-binding protein
MSENCLVDQFRRYGRLTAEDAALLKSLQGREVRHGAGEIVQPQGAPTRELFAVKSGWVATSYLLPDGGRQILDIYMPGDIVGFHDLPFSRAMAAIHTVTEAVLCPFPRQRIADIFRASPRLATIFFTIDMHHHALMVERIVTLGQRSAYERLCHLLLEFAYRMGERFERMAYQPMIPLTQRQLAEVLGLTEVHVNRTVGQLRAERLVEVRRGRMVLLDVMRMAKAVQFKASYLRLDLSWMAERADLAEA